MSIMHQIDIMQILLGQVLIIQFMGSILITNVCDRHGVTELNQ